MLFNFGLEDISPEKRFIPTLRPRLVLRPRLTSKFDRFQNYKLAYISAPAGYGKTTLLAEWISQLNFPVSWLWLDSGDNDPIRFINSIFLAVSKVNDVFRNDLENTLRVSNPPDFLSAIHFFISAISKLPNEIFLVLDDYHEIQNEVCHEGISYLINHAPVNLHLLIATRESPPLNLARVRAQGELLEIGSSELAFTQDEVDKFLHYVMQLDLDEQETQILVQLTEGWVTALQLAGLSLQNCTDCFRFLREFSGDNRHIAEYLIAEVVQLLSEDLRIFLLKTSILEQLNGSLCDTILETQNSDSILLQLENQNLFLIPLDFKRMWYRYHTLFRDLLNNLLKDKFPEEITKLHQRATTWYEANGYYHAAIKHSFASTDFEKACQLIEIYSDKLWGRNEMDTLRDWLEDIPIEHLDRHPRLIILQAWIAVLSGQLKEGEKLLKKAEQSLDVTNFSEQKELNGILKVIHGIFSRMRGNVVEAIKISDEACQLLPSDNLNWLAVAQITIGIANNYLGEVKVASQAFAKATTFSSIAGNQLTSIVSAAQYARLHITKGSLKLAARTCEEALDVANRQGERGWPLAARAHTSLAHVLTEWNLLEEAGEHLEQAITLSQAGENIRNQVEALLEKARWLYACKETDQAVLILDQAETLIQEYQLGEFQNEAIAYRARLEIYNGQLEFAQDWAEAKNLSEVATVSYKNEYEVLTYVRLLIAKDQFSEALGLLDQIAKGATAAGRRDRAIEALVLKALVHLAQEKSVLAIETLKETLLYTEKEGYKRLYLNEGLPAIRMIKLALNSFGPDVKAHYNYLQMLLEESSETEIQATSHDHDLLAEKLTKRELEVLKLIATGISRAEVAVQLFITPNTVDTHIKNIYSKLQIHNKVEALVAARNLGLLE